MCRYPAGVVLVFLFFGAAQGGCSLLVMPFFQRFLNPSSQKTAKAPAAGRHWVVQMNYRNRSVSWIVGSMVLAVHLSGQATPWWVWGALVVQFWVYPQVVYRWALLAPNPLQAEIRNLRLDAVCFGAWAAGLGFALWLCVLLLLTTAMNLAAFVGVRGVLQALAAQALGAGAVVAVAGWRFVPDTRLEVSLLSLATLAGYLVLYGLGAHHRTLKLHQVREKLHANERALQQQLGEIRLLQAQLKEQADRDPLTGLYNRRYLAATMDREFARCRREEAPVSLMMIDIDHFKQVNDQHGHPLGDKVLARVAQTLASSLRAGDVACRYGGEEFLLLMPNMDLGTARQRAQELCQKVACLVIEDDDAASESAGTAPISVHISVGVAEAPSHAREPEDLIAQADAALYRAKSKGRNRVVAWGASGDTVPAPIV